MDNTNPVKLLELTKRVLDAQTEEIFALFTRLKILENADLNDFIDNEAAKFKQTPEYATTEKTIAVVNCKKRIIQLEGEMEGAKMHISELTTTIEENKDE